VNKFTIVASRIPDTIVAFGQTRHTIVTCSKKATVVILFTIVSGIRLATLKIGLYGYKANNSIRGDVASCESASEVSLSLWNQSE
jgi:hypothetical protein